MISFPICFELYVQRKAYIMPPLKIIFVTFLVLRKIWNHCLDVII